MRGYRLLWGTLAHHRLHHSGSVGLRKFRKSKTPYFLESLMGQGIAEEGIMAHNGLYWSIPTQSDTW